MTLDEAMERIQKLEDCLICVSSWECKGDSVKDAYESIYGKGSWPVDSEDWWRLK